MRLELKLTHSSGPDSSTFLKRIDTLRSELADLAFVLECRGRVDAADIAVEISTRLAAWRDELTSAVAAEPSDGGNRESDASAFS